MRLTRALLPSLTAQYLTTDVVALRVKTGVMLGDGEAGSVRDTKHKASASDSVDEAKLKRAIRAHSNFSESTPFAFFLIFLAELNGAPTSLVHGAFSTLFLARVAHGSLGVTTDSTLGAGRPIGAIATIAVTAVAGLYNVSEVEARRDSRGADFFFTFPRGSSTSVTSLSSLSLDSSER